MTTGYDVGGILSAQSLTHDPGGPALQICGGCGQPLDPPGSHLSVCPLIPSSAIPAQTIEAVNDEEKKLGEAV
jgi:hypothetical protein